MVARLAAVPLLVIACVGCSDGATTEPTNDVPICQPTTIDSVLEKAGNCKYWIEVTDVPGCGKVLSLPTTMGIERYRFDSAGKLIDLTTGSDSGSTVLCRNAGTTACTPTGTSTCSFACYAQEATYQTHSCPTPTSDAGSGD